MTQDSFTILEQISQSPSTSVYKAHQNVLDRTILLKVLHKHLMRDKDLVARFTREAKACAILRSENIVQVYDLTEIDGAPAIVMEFVDGKSLEDLLEDPSVRSEDLLLKVAGSVLRALSYAHERGIVHRDIKPGNILVSDDGVIKVTDFGLAAVSDAPSLTTEGSLIGTPAYMSPEQARGEPVDQRTDLFSLGVTLVEVLTGDKILAGRSYAECIGKIQNFRIDAVGYLSGKCSPHVLEFLRKLLAPDREDRFSSAHEALEYLESSSQDAKADAESVGKFKGRTARRWFGLSASVLVALVVVISFIFRHPTDRLATNNADSSAVSVRQTPQDDKPREPGRGTSLLSDRKVTGQSDITEPASTTRNSPDSIQAGGGNAAQLTVSSTENDSGYISVQCTPWAKIYVDSEYAGTTPISGAIKVPAGMHTVTFSNQNFAPIVRQVEVRRNLLASVDADFLKSSGYLFVSVEPWGNVFIDDQFRETTPSVQPIVVSAGTRKIRIHNPNFPDIVKTLTVTPGDTLRLSFSYLDGGR